MRSFTDCQGATWPLRINAAALRRVKDQCGLDFLDAENAGNLWDRVIGDPLTLSDVLRAVVEPTITERGLDEGRFFDLLEGRTLHEAKIQLAEEIVDFFLAWQPAIGESLKAALAAQMRYYARADRMVASKIEKANIDQVINESLRLAEAKIDQELDELRSTSGS